MRIYICTVLLSILAFSGHTLSTPIFPNSVVSNDLEFIQSSDKDVFACVSYQGTDRTEMPDKRNEVLFADGTYIYSAKYEDGTAIEIWAHSDFGSETVARKSVEPVAEAVGKLPTMMRSKLDHIVIHKGNETAFAEDAGHFFVLYSDNIETRFTNHDLEETIFHESVHATLDKKYGNSKLWRKAQRMDGDFVTEYAARLPNKEDLAESALFAWALLIHPGRLPAEIENQVREIMPKRLSFFEELFLKQPIFYNIGSSNTC